MAGVKIEMSTNGSTDWSNAITILQHSYRHYQFISLTNTTSTGAPAIEAGSYAIVNGTMYQLTPSTGGNETISTTGLSTGFTSGELWIKCIPTTGTSITSEYTTTAPTWSASKGGYYSTGNDKYIGGVYKTTDSYCEKWVYEEGKRFSGSLTRPLLERTEEIGTWKMNSTAALTKDIELGIDFPTIRINKVDIIIRTDSDNYFYPVPGGTTGNGANVTMFVAHITSSGRLRLGKNYANFATTNFASTSVNRGYVNINYRG